MVTKVSPAPDERQKLTIAGHSFRRLVVEGTQVGPTITRMLREAGSRRIYLQREGEHVIRGIPCGQAAVTKDFSHLGRAGKVYVMFVEEDASHPDLQS
jgi:hypothetical protein